MTPDDMEARTPAPEGEAVAWRLRRVGVTRWNLWDLDPRTDTAAYADQAQWEVQPLYASPVDPVGVSRETLLKAVRPVLDRHPMIDSSQSQKLDIQAGWVADAILAALGTKGQG